MLDNKKRLGKINLGHTIHNFAGVVDKRNPRKNKFNFSGEK